jgi:hypothetical protein
VTADRKVFAPIPARALRAQRLSGLQLRLLGAIALFDRMGRNEQGCWTGHELLAEIAGCAYTSVSTELGRLREFGLHQHVQAAEEPAQARAPRRLQRRRRPQVPQAQYFVKRRTFQ